ncbi:tetrameric phenylalanine hydroxylase [Linderina pennispora]|uniref:phenylalanine 4-monooxygenase n=1 Tax=Linderina pennispora TaxID=61395 RepID=A0A1Y1W7H0_9FUNG|nr:tetrameric phenylalanine hydroxylase [Linderina pennispora]ORX69471.1 tetrameric phenylalanine hydroxylase [Linderina pennispora]
MMSATKTHPPSAIPWFPRCTADLDSHSVAVLQFGEELESDYVGANDPEYRRRRNEIAKIASMYRTGQTIPYIEYNDNERATWKALFCRMKGMHEDYACTEYQDAFKVLEEEGLFTADDVPQLEDVSNFLRSRSGFSLRPVTGLLTSRDFMNSLAFRVFYCTQYIRHHSNVFFTPEPDVCHELLGHAPMFADPDFAQLAQEIGLASLGASDEDIVKLGNIFWYTIEFGLCKESGKGIRAYGAGLLSSYTELENAFSDRSEKRPFDPLDAATLEHSIVDINTTYYVAESFACATNQLSDYVQQHNNRDFKLAYDAKTGTVNVVDKQEI